MAVSSTTGKIPHFSKLHVMHQSIVLFGVKLADNALGKNSAVVPLEKTILQFDTKYYFGFLMGPTAAHNTKRRIGLVEYDKDNGTTQIIHILTFGRDSTRFSHDDYEMVVTVSRPKCGGLLQTRP